MKGGAFFFWFNCYVSVVKLNKVVKFALIDNWMQVVLYSPRSCQAQTTKQSKLYFTFPYYITLKDICMASYIKVIEVLMVKLNHIDNNDGNA